MAPLAIAGSEPYYRIPTEGALSDWMKQQSIQSLAVFDAAGSLQQCGVLSGDMNAPLATAPTTVATKVEPFDPSACGIEPRPNICFKNQPCSAPDFCPSQEVDLTGTTLEGMTSVDQIVAAGTAQIAPVVCSPLSGDGFRLCDEHDQAALAVLQKAEVRKTEAREFMDNLGLLPDAPAQAELAKVRQQIAARKELLITADRKLEPKGELVFHWSTSTAVPAGYAKLTCYTNGSPSESNVRIEAMADGGRMDAHEWPLCVSRSYRLVLPPELPGLRLDSVTATAYAPKPYMSAQSNQYWFAATGMRPYSVFFEKGHSGCGSRLSLNDAAKLPHANDPDWPPAASPMSVPTISHRSAWTELVASRPDLAAWVYWLLYVGGACLAAFLTLLGYWMSPTKASR